MTVTPSKPARARRNNYWYNWQVVSAKVSGSWTYAKRVYAKAGGAWVEVWNALPEAQALFPNVYTYDSLTLRGYVGPHNFTTSATFYYRKKNTGSYVATATTTGLTGSGLVLIDNVVISGLTEQTTYEYYLSATNAVGTVTSAIQEYTTSSNCSPSASGWSSSTSSNASTCAGCGTVTTVTYTKPGCTTYSTQTSSCGTWSDYFAFVTIPVTGGTYPYVTGTLWGWMYSDSTGNTNYTGPCGSSGYIGPGNVQQCSVGGYRVTGTDTCVYPSFPGSF